MVSKQTLKGLESRELSRLFICSYLIIYFARFQYIPRLPVRLDEKLH